MDIDINLVLIREVMLGLRNASTLAGAYPTSSYSFGQGIVTEETRHNPRTVRNRLSYVNEIVLMDHRLRGIDFVLPRQGEFASYTEQELLQVQEIGHDLLSRLDEFGEYMAVVYEKYHVSPRAPSWVHLPERAASPDMKTELNVIPYATLGERESEGLLNLSLKYWYSGANPICIMTFTMSTEAVCGIIQRQDAPESVDGTPRHYGDVLDALLRTGASRHDKRLLGSNMKMTKKLIRERSKIMHVMTTEILLPMNRVDHGVVRAKMGMILETLFTQTRHVMRLCCQTMKNAGVRLHNRKGSMADGIWIQRPFDFLLSYDSRYTFLKMTGDNVFPGVDDSQAMEQQRLNRSFALLMTRLRFRTSYLGGHHVGHAFSRTNVDTHILDEAGYVGGGLSDAHVIKELFTTSEDDLPWARIGSSRRIRDTQFVTVLRRHYFQYVSVSVRKANAAVLSFYEGLSRVRNPHLMYSGYGKDFGYGYLHPCYPEDAGSFSHKSWWSTGIADNEKTPVGIHSEEVFELRIQMRSVPFEKVHKSHEVIDCSVVYVMEDEMDQGFENVMAHMNAAAMVLYLENLIMDQGHFVQTLDLMKHILEEPVNEEYTRPALPEVVPVKNLRLQLREQRGYDLQVRCKSGKTGIYYDVTDFDLLRGRMVIEIIDDMDRETRNRNDLNMAAYWRAVLINGESIDGIHYANFIEANPNKRSIRDEEATREGGMYKKRRIAVPSVAAPIEDTTELFATAEEAQMLEVLFDEPEDETEVDEEDPVTFGVDAEESNSEDLMELYDSQ